MSDDCSYAEPSTHCLLDLTYSATDEVANRVWLRLIETPEWIEYETLANVLHQVHLTLDDVSTDICKRTALARRALTRVAATIIAEVTG